MFIKGSEGRIWFYREGGKHILVDQVAEIDQDKVTKRLNMYFKHTPFICRKKDEEIIRICKFKDDKHKRLVESLKRNK